MYGLERERRKRHEREGRPRRGGVMVMGMVMARRMN